MKIKAVKIKLSQYILDYMKNILNIILLALLVCSCGKKTNPVPPEFRSPSSVSNLTASATNDYIKLSWALPTKSLNGKDLKNTKYVTIKRKLYDAKRFKELQKLRADATSFFDKSAQTGNIYDYLVYISNDRTGSVDNIIRVNYQGVGSKVNIIGIN